MSATRSEAKDGNPSSSTCASPKVNARINSKNCGQCDVGFKKSQKSMNCSICKYWFCLDCSHVSGKLYDCLKNESTANLPFNCDGCLRILPKLTEMGMNIDNQLKQIKECETKIKEVEESMDNKIEKQVEKAIESFRDREERKCNVIIHNVPEPTTPDRKTEDGEKLRDIFSVIKCDDVTPKMFVRLGKPINGKARLIKVVLESVSYKHQLLGGTKLLRTKDGDGNITHGWNNIYITPDLTKEEREHNRAMHQEFDKKKKDERNPDLIIYRGKIIDRKELSGQAAGNGVFPNQLR